MKIRKAFVHDLDKIIEIDRLSFSAGKPRPKVFFKVFKKIARHYSNGDDTLF